MSDCSTGSVSLIAPTPLALTVATIVKSNALSCVLPLRAAAVVGRMTVHRTADGGAAATLGIVAPALLWLRFAQAVAGGCEARTNRGLAEKTKRQ